MSLLDVIAGLRPSTLARLRAECARSALSLAPRRLNLQPDTRRIAALRRKGWSWRRAATALGVSYTHLAHTLTGRRRSAVLCARIDALGKSEVAYRASGFAARREKEAA